MADYKKQYIVKEFLEKCPYTDRTGGSMFPKWNEKNCHRKYVIVDHMGTTATVTQLG
jgi:hypothetical protein